MLGPRTFRFLNETRELSLPEGWNDPGAEKLWLYNLHYFEDLVAEGAAERAEWHRDLIRAWIAGNLPFEGNGWEPYPVSLRIGYWIKWALIGNELDEAWLRSLALQAEYLSHRVEWHLLGNHVFENARALVMAGLFFDGPRAERWLCKGLRILDGQLKEQILEDGGHFELSPMYHSLVLEGLLDLIQLSEHYERNRDRMAAWREIAEKMLVWLDTMSHPDGQISFFNDAAFDIALTPRALFDYGKRLRVPSPEIVGRERVALLEESGYIRAQRGSFFLLVDVGHVGPDHQPGHAHADTLSFELSVSGNRVLVNSGTSVYGMGCERARQRGTTAHNTLVVDNQDSSEVWAGFRVARRARTFGLSVRGVGDQWLVQASHDGYFRFKPPVTHQRTFFLDNDTLVVKDVLEGLFEYAEAYLHFHPDMEVMLGSSAGRIRDRSGNHVGTLAAETELKLVKSTWHPEFGGSVESSCVIVPMREGGTTFSFSRAM